MRSIFFLFFGLCFLVGCRNLEQSQPLNCLDRTPLENTKKVTFNESTFGMSVSEEWAKGLITIGDTTTSLVCLDTLLLYNDNLIKSITLTTINEKISRPKTYLKSEISRMEVDYQVIADGYSEINIYKAYWVLLRGKDMYTLFYYFFRDKVYLINLSCSITNDYERCLCDLTSYLETISFYK